MVERPSWAPGEVDVTRPSVARVYDYYLGGSHNFESDRVFAQQALNVFPGLPMITRDNRQFLRRAVLELSARGIDQFLDLGSGIPTAGNVHEIAQAVNPSARVVYVDHDPVAVTHSRELLKDNGSAVAIEGDLRNVDDVLADAVRLGSLDLERPVAVLLLSVLHFVSDDFEPAGLVADYLRQTVAGSYLVLSHATARAGSDAAEVAKVYNEGRSPSQMRMRTRPEIEALFGELEVIEPGVVPIPRWRPEDIPDSDVSDDYPGLAGVGRRT